MQVDKVLTIDSWKKFEGKNNYGGDKFVKALSKLAAIKDDAEKQLGALEEIDSHAGALAKDNKSNKEVAKYLASVTAAIDKLKKDIKEQTKKDRAEADKAKAAADKDDKNKDDKQKQDADDDGDPISVLLGQKTLEGMNAARKGQMVYVMIGMAGQNVACMVSRKAISKSRHDLLKKHLDVSGGIKFPSGFCVYDGKSYVFELDKAIPGLAKKLTKMFKDEHKRKYRIVVRAEGNEEMDGDDEDAIVADVLAGGDGDGGQDDQQDGQQDGAGPDDQGGPDAQAAADGPDAGDAPDDADRPGSGDAQAGAGAPGAGDAPPAAAGDGGSAQQDGQLARKHAAFNDHLAQIDGRLDDAALDGPALVKVETLRKFANGKAGQDQMDAALQALDAIDDVIEQTLAARAKAQAGGGNGAAKPASAGDDTASPEDQAAAARIKAALQKAAAVLKAGIESGALAPQQVQDGLRRINEQTAAHDYAGAQRSLIELLRLAQPAAAAPAGAGNGAAGGAAAGGASKHQQVAIDIGDAATAWDGLRTRIEGMLGDLERKALDAVRAHNADAGADQGFDEAQVEKGLKTIYQVMTRLDRRLNAQLDACLKAAPEQRPGLVKAIEGVIGEYEDYVGSDPLLHAIDRSGFIDQGVRETVMTVLSTVRSKLEGARA